MILAAGDPNLMPAILADLAKPRWVRAHLYRCDLGQAACPSTAVRGDDRARVRPRRGAHRAIICIDRPDGSVLIEWGPYIEPPDVDDAAADAGVMDQLIDAIENAVGRYPEQYLHPIGDARRWNAEIRRWEARPSP